MSHAIIPFLKTVKMNYNETSNVYFVIQDFGGVAIIPADNCRNVLFASFKKISLTYSETSHAQNIETFSEYKIPDIQFQKFTCIIIKTKRDYR